MALRAREALHALPAQPDEDGVAHPLLLIETEAPLMRGFSVSSTRLPTRRAAPLPSSSMMRIGLIGDTHYPEAGPLWDEAYDALRDVDLILHAGDLHVIDVLDWLEERCGVPVLAVRGNGDDGSGGRPLCPRTRA